MEEIVLFWDGYLSNWYIAPFVVDGVRYNCVEQYMMAEKARTFDDKRTEKAIMDTPWPKSQKELGRQVTGYNEVVWAEKRAGVVLKATMAKFLQHEDLKKKLLATGKAVIAEASPYDTLWGIGLAEADPKAKDPKQWRGKNLLGAVIMMARELIAGTEATDRGVQAIIDLQASAGIAEPKDKATAGWNEMSEEDRLQTMAAHRACFPEKYGE